MNDHRYPRFLSRSLSCSLGLAGVLSLAMASTARADEPTPVRAARIDAIGRSAASEDGVEAVRINPANLGWMPSWEARYVGVNCEGTDRINCGHVLEAGTPLLFGLSTALRLDYVMTPSTASPIFASSSYTWLTWGLAYRLNDAFSFGASLQGAFSGTALYDGLFGISLGASYRPDPHFGFSLVVQDLNRPKGAPLPTGQPLLDRSYTMAAAFRPTGKRALELGVDVRYLEGADVANGDLWLPRASVAVDIPSVGRVRGDVEISHIENDARRGVTATAGLELALGMFTAGGGALFGSGLGGNDVGEYGTFSIGGARQPGLPPMEHAVSIRIEKTPGTRGHVALLRKLWHISEQRNVDAVALVLRAEPADSLAHAEELADAIRVLRARGKKVLCSLEDNGGRSLYVCANANRIVVNPAGGIRYSGLRMQYLYLAGLLDKLGIKAQFVRIGAHKSAPEQFTNEHASPVAAADHEDYLRNVEAVFNKNLANGRGLTDEQVRAVSLKGPFVAKEAKENKLVDGFAFDDELQRVTREMVGKRVSLDAYEEHTAVPKAFGSRDKVAILYVDGDMVDGRSQSIPILDMKLCGSYTIADTAKALREDSSIKAVVVRIESPGGSSMAADVMWRELHLLAERKPVIVSMGSVAASGGYYIASAAKEIYALPLTLTGSIGIFYGKADVSGLLSKIGVNVDTYRTTPRADAESLFRPFTPDEQAELQRKVKQFYDIFLERVAQGRHMTTSEVDAVGQGRVWVGQQAIENKLVDKMGGLREALDEARALGGLPDDAPIAEYPVVERSLVEWALGINPVDHAMTIDGLPVQLRDAARAIAPFAVYAPDAPMARLEWVSLEGEGKD
ncbi:MAG TPA: signal peptide peptidase SppA [Polyangiaceae bacterium]|nr:signal peptide peptidase SppA [Polyangiaceae bacterium]